MALDRFVILAQTIKIIPVFTVENGPEKKGLENIPKMHFSVFLKSSSFPTRRAKNVVSTRQSREQTGLKAIYIYTYIYVYIYMWL